MMMMMTRTRSWRHQALLEICKGPETG